MAAAGLVVVVAELWVVLADVGPVVLSLGRSSPPLIEEALRRAERSGECTRADKALVCSVEAD